MSGSRFSSIDPFLPAGQSGGLFYFFRYLEFGGVGRAPENSILTNSYKTVTIMNRRC